MIFIKIDSLETVNKLVSICNEYKSRAYVDVIYGRYTVDGCSVLGVASLMGNIVRVKTNPDINDELYEDLKLIGAWVEKN